MRFETFIYLVFLLFLFWHEAVKNFWIFEKLSFFKFRQNKQSKRMFRKKGIQMHELEYIHQLFVFNLKSSLFHWENNFQQIIFQVFVALVLNSFFECYYIKWKMNLILNQIWEQKSVPVLWTINWTQNKPKKLNQQEKFRFSLKTS